MSIAGVPEASESSKPCSMAETTNTLRRRQFLQAAACAAAAGAVSCGGRSSPWRFFTVHEAETVAAVSDRIIPADQDAGAAWNRDHQLHRS